MHGAARRKGVVVCGGVGLGEGRGWSSWWGWGGGRVEQLGEGGVSVDD